MSYVYPDVTINDTALREIEPETFTANLIDGDGAIDIRVDFTGGSTVYACKLCGAPLDEDGTPEDDSNTECPSHPDAGEYHMCGQDCDTPVDEDDEGGCGKHLEDKPTPHTVGVAPLGWVNSAALVADPGKDEVQVHISVGDPRGAFVMRVERFEDQDEEGRTYFEYRLSVPHPDESQGHAPLTDLNSVGYYRIGARTYQD